MKLKKNIIYNTFGCNQYTKNKSLNDILKGTKSVLTSRNGYKNYIYNYSQFTKRATFKNPEITDYPIVKKEYSYLVPVKKVKNNNKSEDNGINIKKKQKKINLFSNIIQNEHKIYLEKYTKRFYKLLRLKTESKNMKILKKRIHEKRFKRYNSLFLDFFDKWNDYNINLTQNSYIRHKNIINEIYSTDNDSYEKEINNKINFENSDFNVKERYHDLHYDENEIFNSSYDEFIDNRLNDIKKNKIKNYMTNLESSFNDANDKKIEMKFESIKINFYEVKSKNNEKNKNNFFIYLPLSFVFLFYYRDIDFFEKILMSILYFQKDFKSIICKDDELYNLLNNKTKKKEEKKEEQEIDYLSNFHESKNTFSEQNTFLKGNFKQNIIDKKELYNKEFRKTFNKNNLVNRLYFHKRLEKNETINNNQKIKIIHSNKYYKNSNYKCEEIKNEPNLDKDETNKKHFYNEYYFIWETPEISYKVKIEMPKIHFLYEEIGHDIVTYCEKNLFLFLYKNNFINWDFYAINYIFSLKDFRNIILQLFSFNNDYSSIKNKISKNKIKSIVNISAFKINKNIYNLIEDKNDKIKTIFLINKKIYNHINENFETYKFFYSSNNLKNYILNFHSYKINIDYIELNPKIKWEFFLNFKQMWYLNEISKDENLYSFLPKIIRANFEFGILDINFSIFDDNFNAKILEKTNIDKRENNEMNIVINKPYVEIEKILDDENKISKQEFNYIFLQELNKAKMEGWSKKILEFLKDKYIFERRENRGINYIKFESKFFKNNGINGNANDIPKLKYRIKRNSKQKLTYHHKIIKNYEDILKSLKNKSKEE